MCVYHFDKDILVCSMAQWTGVLECGGHHIVFCDCVVAAVAKEESRSNFNSQRVVT